jgi:cell wall-associated NlpC family hydrolase
MRRISFTFRTKLLIVLFAAIQLINSSCSRRLYTETSFPNIENRAEKKKMKEFIAGGIEKEINTRNISPETIIKTAEKYLGVPHCMGGTTSKCMDCSGLLVTVFASHGIRLPHNSEEQARYGKIMNGAGKLKRGDLVFFVRSYKTDRFITHSGIYIGNNRFIHASTTNGVTITSLSDPWWKGKFIFGTRLFN